MKVIVTGGCGFLGSHVCEFYAQKGAEVIAYDNLTKHELQRTGFAVEAARDYNIKFLKGLGVKVVKADVRNLSELMDHSAGCDYIIHTAAQPAMTISWEDPLLDMTSNVMGTFNVLETARKRKIPVACCATVHVYGNAINAELTEGPSRYQRQPEAIDETYPTLQGTITPLHASKAAGDIYVKAYIDTYQLQAASFRLTGIYGTRQFGGEDHGWVANFSIRALINKPITIFGTGKQLRDILYVSDVVEAFDAFYKNPTPGIYTIGGGPETMISLVESIKEIENITGKKLEVKYEKDRFGDLRYFVGDYSKFNKETGWKAKVTPAEGIKKLINWVKDNEDLFK